MRRRVATTCALLAALAASAVPAAADLSQPAVVSANPVDWTPHVLDGTVRAIAVVGDTVVVGGNFSAVADSRRRAQYERWFLFAFDRYTGAVREGFAPAVDGPVNALVPGGDGTVYVGGAFRGVNGAAQRGLARLRVSDGARDTAFGAAISWGEVRAMAAHRDWLYVGGTFTAVSGVQRVALARLDAGTGEVDGGFDMALTAPNLSRVKVEDLALSPDGSRLVAIGAITYAAGLRRDQLVMVDTGVYPARVADWWTNAYQPRCRPVFETYVRGVDFSPGGSYFVVVTTGRATHPERTCDTAARFETGGTGGHGPTWVNHTGGDSLYSVAITGRAVYVGGHQRWLDNPYGNENPGRGAVSRPGIGALDPETGRALPWNPTRARGVGVRAFQATPEGLFVGSDTEMLGRERHDRIGMFPLP